MGRTLRIITLSLALALLAAAGATPAASAEPDVPSAILDTAIAAYKAGNFEPAIGGINAAMRGGLSTTQTARAYYYRGLAYRRQGQPGHAISDLTRALDSDRLTPAERSDAMEARSAAYQEAGIADQETVVVTPGSARPPKAPSATAAATGSTGTTPAGKPAGKWDGATQVAVAAPLPIVTTTLPPSSTPAPTAKPAVAAKTPAAAKVIAPTITAPLPIVTTNFPPPSSPAPAAKPAPETKPVSPPKAEAAPAFVTTTLNAPKVSPPSGVAAKLDVPAKPAPPKPEVVATPPKPVAAAKLAAPPKEAASPGSPPKATASSWPAAQVAAAKTPPPAAKPEAAPSAANAADKIKAKALAAKFAEPPTSPFATQVAMVTPAELPPPAPVATAAIPPAAVATPLPAPAAPPATPAATPEFRLLVGETRTRSEAFALAVRLTSQRGASLGPRRPQIAAGTMADVAVYRVRLGPFTDAGQAQSVCQSLRESGYPCIFE